MKLWFTEKHSPNLELSIRVNETLLRTRSKYQDIAVLDTPEFGRVLTLDGIVQTTERDEFVYHEMITHVPLCSHPKPRRVLVIGGGDGGTVREVLKHDSVAEVVLVEIDEQVIQTAKEFFPTLSSALTDSRCRVEITDGIEFVNNSSEEYDVVIIDSTDPVGPAEGLFSAEFYRSVHNALTDTGLFTAQTESPFIQSRLIADVSKRVQSSFPIVRLYTASIPTYPSGLWTFTTGSKQIDPSSPLPDRDVAEGLKYYSTDIHAAAFVLPPFVQDILTRAT